MRHLMMEQIQATVKMEDNVCFRDYFSRLISPHVYNVKASRVQNIINYKHIRFLKSKNTREKTTFPF